VENGSELSFSKKVRVRVCGVLIEDNAILLVKHEGLGSKGYFWSPPGGGVEFGESVEQTLIREFQEETGLTVKVGQFLLFHEHIDSKFHALELFFTVHRVSGTAALGIDPELEGKTAMMVELRSFSFTEIQEMPLEIYHSGIPEFFRLNGGD
jgi:8-oxo-dGTP diphosphatase